MAHYPEVEEIILANERFRDPLFGALGKLEMRTAFAVEPEPGRSGLPTPEPRISSSDSVAAFMARADVEDPSVVAVVLDTKNRPIHVFDGPPVRDGEEAMEALDTLLRAAILGGGVHMIVVRYEPMTERARADFAEDRMLAAIQRYTTIDPFLPVLDYIWQDPDGTYMSALDRGELATTSRNPDEPEPDYEVELVEVDTGGKRSFEFRLKARGRESDWPRGPFADTETIGMISAYRAVRSDRVVYIVRNVGVHPAFQRRGWGTVLYEAAAAEACRRRSVLASEGPRTDAAQGFWDKQVSMGNAKHLGRVRRGHPDRSTYVIDRALCPRPDLG